MVPLDWSLQTADNIHPFMMVIEAKHLMSGHEMTDTYAYTIQYALAGHSSCFLSGVVVAALLFFGCFLDRTDSLRASR